MRRRVTRESESQLPLTLEPSLVQYLTPALIDEAEAIRKRLVGVPQRVVKREVRDMLDRARLRIGPVGRAGMRDVSEEILLE